MARRLGRLDGNLEYLSLVHTISWIHVHSCRRYCKTLTPSMMGLTTVYRAYASDIVDKGDLLTFTLRRCTRSFCFIGVKFVDLHGIQHLTSRIPRHCRASGFAAQAVVSSRIPILVQVRAIGVVFKTTYISYWHTCSYAHFSNSFGRNSRFKIYSSNNAPTRFPKA